MKKHILLAMLLAGIAISATGVPASAKGPPNNTRGYTEYCDHAGNFTHAGDPINIDPDGPGGGF